MLNRPQPSADTHDSDNHATDKNEAFDFIVVCGKTHEGKKFRPSDWCDRLYGTLRALGDLQEEVVELVHLVNYENQKCFLMEKELESISPEAYAFFLNFARDNDLSIHRYTRENWEALRR